MTTHAEALEAERTRDIDAERETIHDLLADINADAAAIQRALHRLGESGLYDVEVAEGTAARAITFALGQVTLASAALSALVPKPGA